MIGLSSETDIEEAKIFGRVEDFIRRVHDMDYVIDKKAEKLVFAVPGEKERHLSLTGALATSMAEYEVASAEYLGAKKEAEQSVDLPEGASPHEISLAQKTKELRAEIRSRKYETKLLVAEKCLIMIDRAFTAGIVKQGQHLTRKLRECMTQREELERQLYEAQQKLQELQRNYDGLNKLLRSKRQTGDVKEE